MKWVLKTSAVRVAADDVECVYPSVEEVPAELRKKLKQSLEGPESQTILIANQAVLNQLRNPADPLPAEMERFRSVIVEKHHLRSPYIAPRKAALILTMAAGVIGLIVIMLLQFGTS